MASTPPEPPPKAFKKVLSRFPSGVTVVTTRNQGEPHGLTVSAFSAVSAEPPRVLVCLGRDTDSLPMVRESGCFAVHILGREHARLAARFAKMLPGVDDLFEGLAVREEVTSAPILSACLGWLDCTVESSYEVGDHTVLIGAVRALGPGEADGEPLLYFNRAFRSLASDPLDV
ncbi:MAG: flavin reductase family protein [Myxococcales bacterium]|nr:flavin reductase family protein [Myxococcales bacterium]